MRSGGCACDAVAVGYGFTANVDLGLSLGCATRMSTDGGLAIATDADGRTSVTGVFAAGEITGVGGAELSVAEGELAGDAVAREVGPQAALSRRDIVGLRRRAGRLRAFADVMHEVHAVPAGWPSRLSDGTIVCRCEEVPYGRIADAVTELGATDARSVKLLARPGMGWCQGRVCGYATAALTADLCGRAVAHDDLVALAQRPFSAPVRLEESGRRPLAGEGAALGEERDDGVDVGQIPQGHGGAERRIPEGARARLPWPDVRVRLGEDTSRPTRHRS